MLDMWENNKEIGVVSLLAGMKLNVHLSIVFLGMYVCAYVVCLCAYT
jgi:hypothetical protein